jgi:hypothetical protein
MQGSIPIPAKHAADTELHSRKCSCLDAMESVEADAIPAKNMAAAMSIQYLRSNFQLVTVVPDQYLMRKLMKNLLETIP